jgi:hypothetical protein
MDRVLHVDEPLFLFAERCGLPGTERAGGSGTVGGAVIGMTSAGEPLAGLSGGVAVSKALKPLESHLRASGAVSVGNGAFRGLYQFR